MKPTAYQLTPVGYRTPLYDQIRDVTVADELILEAYGQLATNRMVSTRDWNFHRKVINRVLDNFHDLQDWLRAQEHNPRMTRNMHEFLADTIQYINTGRRSMSIDSRVMLIQAERQNDQNTKVYRPGPKERKLHEMLNVPRGDYMWYWLQHHYGFIDMVTTANVIFGDPNSAYPSIG